MKCVRLITILAAAAALGALPTLASSLPPRTQALMQSATAWPAGSVVAVGNVRDGASALESAGNILAVYLDREGPPTLRVSLVAPVGIADKRDWFDEQSVQVIALIDEGPGGNSQLPAPLSGTAPFAWDRMVVLQGSPAAASLRGRGVSALSSNLPADRVTAHLDEGWLAASLEGAAATPSQIAIFTVSGGRVLDQLVAPVRTQANETNVAFLHHANQGLAFTDYFKGRYGAESTSGYDEILRVHEQYNVPGNFHVAAMLQTVAEWNKQNGDPLDFNQWLRNGVTAGWADMICSAYGQPIMPFIQGAMNDWAINRDHAMVNFRYGYNAHVAWVPERTFLDPSTYPNAGVIDWSGAHWQANGVNAVVLDDSPHCNGHNNHRIHTLSGNGLRIIPRDGNFTGKLHTGDGAGALAILTSEANSGVGNFRITVYADDWEMAAGVAGWETTFPFAEGTYQWMIQKCSTESAWLHTWKLDAAIGNANFNGDTFTPTYGTYGGIGDVQGYGGNNNAWYTDWAGYVPYSTGGNGSGACGGSGNCKNFGTLWNDAHSALQAAPNNAIREAGWYVLMSNLHETAWHDYLGGPISGWQRQYASHIKNASVYAEAARWAGGVYANATGCYLSDIDDDGTNELVIYNDRVMGVFESIGGRCTQLFAKGSGYAYPVIGVDNAYWAGTEGDYNDVNHVAGLSDVGPNYQNDLYSLNVDVSAGNTVKATLTRSGVTKTISLTLGQPYMNCVYRVGANTQYIQSGFTPDMVDQLYNAKMDRVWGGGNQTYMGYRNPNTSATGAYVLGAGGATFNLSNTSTIMKVDEIRGTQKFQFYLFAGATSPLSGGGGTAELDALVGGLTDVLPPEATGGTYYPATRQLVLNFDEPVQASLVVPTSIRLDANNDGTADATLDGGTTVLTTGTASTITLQVSTAVHNAILAFTNKNDIRLLLLAGAVKDAAANPNAMLTNTGNVKVSYGPATLITLDGRFDAAEWPGCSVAILDTTDSQWNSLPAITNEIEAIYTSWDSTYLYLGLRGVATNNSWILYLDTDPNGPNGQTDLTATNAWERGATFTAPGFKPDWELGAYQHQGAFDSQSFFKLLTATTTANYTDSILKAFDPSHSFGINGGSELAIPWSTLYGLGPNHVPANAKIGLVSSLAYDPEPSGQLGGDQAPSNISALAPIIDNRTLVTLDANGDGIPDPIDRAAPTLASASPTGYDSLLTIVFNEPVTTASANQASHYSVYETANPSNNVVVKSATLQPDLVTVVLKVDGLAYRAYTVVASGIADRSCYANLQPQTSAAFQGLPVAVDGRDQSVALALRSIVPNPSMGSALISYAVPAGGAAVGLDLYDLSGRVVRSLAHGSLAAGQHTTAFDGHDSRGARLAPGLYFVRLSRGPEVQVKRFIVVP